MAGDADIVLVVDPAGTGKTTALAPALTQIQALWGWSDFDCADRSKWSDHP